MPFWGVVMGVVNIIMGVARGRYHQLPVGVAMVPEGSLKKLEPMLVVCHEPSKGCDTSILSWILSI